MSKKYVYLFSEGNAKMRELLGGKGANLAEMTNIGLPVPQGFTISTEACTKYYEDGKTISQDIIDEIYEAIAKTEKIVGKTFGDSENPFLVSVRSGARASMLGTLRCRIAMRDAALQTPMVVLIDSLASGDTIRIGRSVQITDTGIIPGSGIGNRRVPLNKDTLGIDVIAIGMPMVTYASNIIRSATDKQMDASYEDMVVTPKNIDEIVEKSAETIAFAIDYALNPHIKRDLIDLLRM